MCEGLAPQQQTPRGDLFRELRPATFQDKLGQLDSWVQRLAVHFVPTFTREKNPVLPQPDDLGDCGCYPWSLRRGGAPNKFISREQGIGSRLFKIRVKSFLPSIVFHLCKMS